MTASVREKNDEVHIVLSRAFWFSVESTHAETATFLSGSSKASRKYGPGILPCGRNGFSFTPPALSLLNHSESFRFQIYLPFSIWSFSVLVVSTTGFVLTSGFQFWLGLIFSLWIMRCSLCGLRGLFEGHSRQTSYLTWLKQKFDPSLVLTGWPD